MSNVEDKYFGTSYRLPPRCGPMLLLPIVRLPPPTRCCWYSAYHCSLPPRCCLFCCSCRVLPGRLLPRVSHSLRCRAACPDFCLLSYRTVQVFVPYAVLPYSIWKFPILPCRTCRTTYLPLFYRAAVRSTRHSLG